MMLVRLPFILASAAAPLSAGFAIGFPLTAYLERNPKFRAIIAPGLGLAVFGAIATSAFSAVPLRGPLVVVLVAALAIAARWRAQKPPEPLFVTAGDVQLSWILAAVLLCLAPALAVAPQRYGAGVGLANVIYDHAKVPIIDEIVNNGLPPHNPFFSEAHSPNLLTYYYVWYAIAACASAVTGATGWESEIALTGVTALVSILTIGWLAVARSGNFVAAWWALALLSIGALRKTVVYVSGPWIDGWLSREHGLETWIYQAAWVPQHLLSATFALLGVLLTVRLLSVSSEQPRVGVVLGAVVATAYGCSTWVGGIGLLAVLPLAALLCAYDICAERRLARVVQGLTLAVAIALLSAAVLLYQQFALVGKTHLIAVWMFPVFAESSSIANFLGYWSVLLLLDFGPLSPPCWRRNCFTVSSSTTISGGGSYSSLLWR